MSAFGSWPGQHGADLTWKARSGEVAAATVRVERDASASVCSRRDRCLSGGCDCRGHRVQHLPVMVRVCKDELLLFSLVSVAYRGSYRSSVAKEPISQIYLD